MKYFVDFGHGGNDSGAVNGSVLEKNINKLVGDRVVYHLKRHNQNVVITRNNDDTVSLDERVNIINRSGCDLGISIHCNSYTDKTVMGLETYTWGTGAREKLLAEKVHKSVKSAKLYNKDRGIKQAQFRILSPSIPCILIELGFISNDKEKDFILNNIENFAIAITKGLLGFYDMSYINEKNVTVEPVKPIEKNCTYFVQVGAYKVYSNAVDMKNQLIKQGFPAIIKEG